jgi:hypothetical protein
MGSAHPAVSLADCVALLEARRVALCEEINEYARPVAACDVDFNAMIAERSEITGALSRLSPILRAEARISHPRDA